MKLKHLPFEPAYSELSEFDLNNNEYEVCLADYCDIFECREQSEKILRNQLFMDREKNFEGQIDKQMLTQPYRYYLVS